MDVTSDFSANPMPSVTVSRLIAGFAGAVVMSGTLEGAVSAVASYSNSLFSEIREYFYHTDSQYHSADEQHHCTAQIKENLEEGAKESQIYYAIMSNVLPKQEQCYIDIDLSDVPGAPRFERLEDGVFPYLAAVRMEKGLMDCCEDYAIPALYSQFDDFSIQLHESDATHAMYNDIEPDQCPRSLLLYTSTPVQLRAYRASLIEDHFFLNAYKDSLIQNIVQGDKESNKNVEYFFEKALTSSDKIGEIEERLHELGEPLVNFQAPEERKELEAYLTFRRNKLNDGSLFSLGNRSLEDIELKVFSENSTSTLGNFCTSLLNARVTTADEETQMYSAIFKAMFPPLDHCYFNLDIQKTHHAAASSSIYKHSQLVGNSLTNPIVIKLRSGILSSTPSFAIPTFYHEIGHFMESLKHLRERTPAPSDFESSRREEIFADSVTIKYSTPRQLRSFRQDFLITRFFRYLMKVGFYGSGLKETDKTGFCSWYKEFKKEDEHPADLARVKVIEQRLDELDEPYTNFKDKTEKKEFIKYFKTMFKRYMSQSRSAISVKRAFKAYKVNAPEFTLCDE